MTKTEKNKNIFTQKQTKVFSRIIKDIKPISGWLILCFLISAASVAFAIAAPIYLGQITDRIYNFWAAKQSGGAAVFDKAGAIADSIALALVYLFSSLCSTGNMLILNNVVSRFYTCGLRVKMSEKIIRMPVGFVDKTPSGEIISRMMSDVSHMGTTVHTVLNLATQGFLQLVGVAIMMFRINFFMALLVMVVVPLSIVISAIIANRSEKYFGEARKQSGKWYAFVEEDYAGFDTVKAFHLEERQNRGQGELAQAIRDHDKKGNALSGLVQPIISFTNSLAFAGICILGGFLATTNQVTGAPVITVGDVVAVIMYAKLLAGPLEGIAYGISMLQRVFASARRIYDFLEEKEMLPPEVNELPEGRGEVEFQDVNFSYSPDKPLIENLSLKIKAGQKVAIVGPTGGGKTTIVNLLMRFYDVDSGKILIDGVDATKMDRRAVRDMFGMVLQDTWLYSGTVYDNIAYGKENASHDEVLNAAQNARIDFFVNTLPEGYETLINEESNNISAGQKQLLTIARAYLANKRMLILDEATSNVDTRTELLIQETMDKLSKGKTSFVIAHRLSTIVDADIILVVDNGHIVESGTHEELMAKNGFYTEIYNSQYDLLS